jgi:hypothetical protein
LSSTVFSARARLARCGGVSAAKSLAGRGRHHPHFVGIARAGRHEGDRVLVAVQHPLAVGGLVARHVAQQAGAVLQVVLALLRQLARGHRRHEGIGIDLAVRMVQRDADLGAAVLERQHVLDVVLRADALRVRSPQTCSSSSMRDSGRRPARLSGPG